MPHTAIVTHRHARLVHTNLVAAKPKEVIDVCHRVQQLMQGQSENSVLSLMEVAGMRYNAASLQVMKETLKANRPFVKASAIVGLDGLAKLVFQTAAVFSGRDIRVFQDVDLAKEWLLSKHDVAA